MESRVNGKLITFEGSEGSGKSTQIQMLADYLASQGREVLILREPGGVKISELIRDILLDPQNKNMGNPCETLLYMASRAQLVQEVLKPALDSGTTVLCDRFLDSTIAYQGYGNGGDLIMIKQIGQFVTQGIQPHITFLMDIDAADGLRRIDRAKDRIEQRAITYHQKVREGYLALARQEPERIKVINVNDSREAIHRQVRAYMQEIIT